MIICPHYIEYIYINILFNHFGYENGGTNAFSAISNNGYVYKMADFSAILKAIITKFCRYLEITLFKFISKFENF